MPQKKAALHKSAVGQGASAIEMAPTARITRGRREAQAREDRESRHVHGEEERWSAYMRACVCEGM